MKNKWMFGFLLCFTLFVLTGCKGYTTESLLTTALTTTTDLTDTNSTAESDLRNILHPIYLLAIEAEAFEGTYEEWLETVRGPQGTAGKEVAFQVAGGYIQWHYVGDIEWINLISLTSLLGPKGDDGFSAYEIYLIYHPEYTGDEEQWIHDLVNGDLREVDTSTITFMTNGGTLVSPITQEEGTVVLLPEDPTKEGYTFDGWFSDEALLISYIVSSMPTEDLILFASWEEVLPEAITFTLQEDDTYEVTGYLGIEPDLIVPSTHLGKPVTGIGEGAFANSTTLRTIVLPASVKSIGHNAFSYATFLTTIIIESGSQLTSIGDYAFYGASALTNLFIPASVTSIGENQVFILLNSLTAIIVDPDNDYYSSENGVLFDKTKTVLIAYPSGKTDNEYNIPAGVTEIGKHAFYSCTHLTAVFIPASVQSIGDVAFEESRALSSVTFETGSQLTSIGNLAFSRCDLTAIVIPLGVTEIHYAAFNRNVHLVSVTIPPSVTTIGDMAFFYCTSMSTIFIPNSVIYMGQLVFSFCTNLTIHVQAIEKPAGWYSNWNEWNCPVLWGSIS